MQHYVNEHQNVFLEYLVYQVHPFGYEQNNTEVLPSKLSLEAVIARSDAHSFAPEYREHKKYMKIFSIILNISFYFFLGLTILKKANDINEIRRIILFCLSCYSKFVK